MSFLNPLYLFGLLAAAIPVVIHLFTRRRPRQVPFPSLEFLSEVNQSEIRRLKLRQWLLLLLRTLAVLALALAVARPAVRGAIGPASDAATTVVVLVDRSGSMSAAAARAEGGATLLDAARRVVEDLLTTLGPQDEILFVPYDRAPQPMTSGPSADVGRVRTAAQALAATATTTDHAAALAAAGAALGRSHALNRELFWVSDFQRSGFGAGATPAPPAGTAFTPPTGPWAQSRVYLIPLSPRRRDNVALSDASLAPTEGDVALAVEARAFDAPAGDLAVEVLDAVNEEPLGRGFLALPARGEASALLPLARLPEGGGIARIPDDGLALDNRRAFTSGRSGTIRALLREDVGPSALRLALEAGAPASGLEVVATDGATLAQRARDADVIVVNDVERLGATELQAVLDFHRAGGGLFVVLGARADTTFWNSGPLAEIGAGRLGAEERAAPGAAWRLTRAVPGHATLAGFPARPGEPLSSARFQTVRAFRPGPGARTLLAYDRGRPALVEAAGVLVFVGSLDPQASDFPVSGAFLPLMHQVVKTAGRGTAAASLVPGERYTAPAGTGLWRIEDSGGREVASELAAERGATRLRSAPIERPGLYSVRRDGAIVRTFAVNPDPAESDLAAMPERVLVASFPAGRARVLQPGTDLARRVREARYGRELWGWFVIAALGLLVAETVLGRWGMARRLPRNDG